MDYIHNYSANIANLPQNVGISNHVSIIYRSIQSNFHHCKTRQVPIFNLDINLFCMNRTRTLFILPLSEALSNYWGIFFFSLFSLLILSQPETLLVLSFKSSKSFRISDLFRRREKEWHSLELLTNARPVIRLFMLLTCCPLKECLIINPASNAAIAKELLWYVLFCICFFFSTILFLPSSFLKNVPLPDEQLLIHGWSPLLQDSFRATFQGIWQF